jgi:putative serine protease PepD
VAANGGTLTVVTNDGQQANASIVGRDTSDDLAVVKVSGLKNLVPASFAKSSNVVIGQTVIAVGAPLGLSDTVTSGIVSNTARPVRSGDNDQAVFDAIQTDAAINPGNSGGALADLNGNVIGINAAIATPNTGGLQIPGQTQQSGSIGIGFAIPSDEVSRIAAELIATGKATHAFLGVGPTNQQANNVAGAQIGSVAANSAAAKAGLKVGDTVTKVDDQRVDDFDGLAASIRSHVPGQTVTLTIIRDGKTSTLRVTLGSQTG